MLSTLAARAIRINPYVLRFDHHLNAVVDLRGDGDHYGARVTSGIFEGKSRIQQHKMVYDALQGQMGGALHALALETIVPK